MLRIISPLSWVSSIGVAAYYWMYLIGHPQTPSHQAFMAMFALELAGFVLFQLLWRSGVLDRDPFMWFMTAIVIGGVWIGTNNIKEPLLFWGFLLGGAASMLRSWRAWIKGATHKLDAQAGLTALLFLGAAAIVGVLTILGLFFGYAKLEKNAAVFLGLLYFTAQALREILPIDRLPQVRGLFRRVE
jgi:hypothetical protein